MFGEKAQRPEVDRERGGLEFSPGGGVKKKCWGVVTHSLSLSLILFTRALQMARTRRNFGGAPNTRRKRSPGAKKRQMSKRKMGIILGSVAVATAAAVALGVKKPQIQNYVNSYFKSHKIYEL